LKIRLPIAVVSAIAALAPLAPAIAAPIPASFASTGADRKAIEALLDTYTRAVSAKDEALFETILLNKDITFSDAASAAKADGAPHAAERYDSFRKGVFEGPSFTQRFRDVHIDQDGALANVTLVFVNTSPRGSGWGWKTLQLLKVDGRWKIASELYTAH
jgi:ketosteroid isomerase-like protein